MPAPRSLSLSGKDGDPNPISKHHPQEPVSQERDSWTPQLRTVPPSPALSRPSCSWKEGPPGLLSPVQTLQQRKEEGFFLTRETHGTVLSSAVLPSASGHITCEEELKGSETADVAPGPREVS